MKRISALSMLRYGPEVAVPRIVETYKKCDFRQIFFIPAHVPAYIDNGSYTPRIDNLPYYAEPVHPIADAGK